MKIVHLCLACFFPDGFTYQENMLPKWHKRLGYDVEVIASLLSFDEYGRDILLPGPSRYLNEYAIPVTRLAYKEPVRLYRKLGRYIGLADALEKAAPDTLFIHGCQFLDIDIVVAYLKYHRNVKVYVDNHADYSNSARNWLSKHILHRIIWKRCAQLIEPFTITFWGVLPARVDFLIDNYGIQREKCDLLIMGADDDEVERAAQPKVRASVRERYCIGEEHFLIVTGGKIDSAKIQIFNLMECVANSSNANLRLLIFGSVAPELQDRFNELVSSPRITFVGWMDSRGSYDCFAAADLVCFPGRHSVFWEQAVAQGKPLLVKRWDGTNHIDCGGNVRYINSDSLEELSALLIDVSGHEQHQEMLDAAARCKNKFLYRSIAMKGIGVCPANDLDGKVVSGCTSASL